MVEIQVVDEETENQSQQKEEIGGIIGILIKSGFSENQNSAQLILIIIIVILIIATFFIFGSSGNDIPIPPTAET